MTAHTADFLYAQAAPSCIISGAMFDEAGVAYPEEGWTTDDMLPEIAKKQQFPESSTESASQPATRTCVNVFY